MAVQVKINDEAVLRKYSPSGIPVEVRNNLRRTIPDLVRRLGASVESKLDSELKSRTHVVVDKFMHDSTKDGIYGEVTARWTGDSSKSFIPTILESGAKAHEIRAKNASALFFFWEKLGKNVMFKKVWHPGFPGIFFMERSFHEMQEEIIESISDAVRAGANKAA